MRNTILGIFCVMFVIQASTGYAEFYQWVDDQGVKHFSDNLADVPKDRRPNLKVHQSSLPKEEAPSPPEIKGTVPADTLTGLEAEKAALDAEYNAIHEKRKELLDRQTAIPSKEYNDQINQLNARITAFEKKRLAFEEKVKQYNQQIDTANTKE